MSAQAKLNNDVFTTEKPDLITRRLSILNLKSVDHVSAGGSGSIRSLGWAEISAALSFAQLDNVSYLLVRVIHCHDKVFLAQLVVALTDRLVATKTAQGQVICGGKHDVIRRLVTVALFDYLSPAANRPVSMRERASVAGIPKTTYDRKYDGIVDSVLDLLSDLYAVARTKIYRQLSSHSED